MKHCHLYPLNNNSQGVSVVIGALMLTVIVVTAATSFALFTAQKQEEIQNVEYQNTIKNLEKLSINYFNFNNTAINISIHNDWTKTSVITGIQINKGWWKNDSQLSIKNHLDAYNSALFNISYVNIHLEDYLPVANKPLILTIHTINGNSFEDIYYPPNAIIKINYESLWDGAAYQNYQILDGSSSNHPEDGYMVNWTWDTPSGFLYGQKVQPSTPLTSGDTILLIVTDNYGMKATTTLTL